ncbi:MAG: cytosolic protein [Planctomycetes bacterium]|nr:cytosolic protein [Planctomycetota bacterium]
MPKRAQKPEEFDSPWKEALHAYLPQFLLFFFPDIQADIDWSRGYEDLDKEFQKIARRAKVGKRLADKLFKVWLMDGTEHWLLIHIEIQGDHEKEFEQRMFDYNAAARQLYNRDVISLSILCDDRPDWRPTTFTYGRWGCRMELTFRIAKLLDHAEKVEELDTSDNPIATLVLAHCKTLETRRDPESRKAWKLRIVRGPFQRNWSKEKVREAFRVIDWVMALPDDLEAEFLDGLDEIEEEGRMEFVTSIERRGFKRGIEEGIRTGLLEAVSGTLKNRFGAAGRRLLPKVRAFADLAALRRFKDFLDTAESLAEVREYLS